jgi:hypothetical protein
MMIHILQSLPDWTQIGAIVGLQGETNQLKKLIESFSEAKVPNFSAKTTLKMNEDGQQSNRGESYWQLASNGEA